MHNKSVLELSKLLNNKEISSSEITKYCLERIKKYDSEIQSFITVCEDEAIKAAQNADEMISNGNYGLFTGIPYGVKDNICIKGIKTTCASKMLESFVPPYSATAVERLSDAVILGKLNMDEFGMGSSTENSYLKKTKNPFDYLRVPGGSSGGAAAAVSAEFIPFALASDTGGSVRQPAAFCGVVGIKPTYGRVSRYGLVAYASSLDQIGIISKNVKDESFVLSGISGKEEKEATTVSEECELNIKGDIKGLKIGVPKEYFSGSINAEVKEKVLSCLETLESLGAKCEEYSLLSTDKALSAYYIIACAEASSNLARYDGVRYGLRADGNTIEEMYKNTRTFGFGDEVKRRIMLGSFVLSAGFKDEYYKKANYARCLIASEFEKCFETFDAIITPTTVETAFKFGEKKTPAEMYASDLCTVPVNLAGLPAVSIPCGKDKGGMPIGVQIIGKKFDEQMILNIAYAMEQELKLDLKPDQRGEA